MRAAPVQRPCSMIAQRWVQRTHPTGHQVGAKEHHVGWVFQTHLPPVNTSDETCHRATE